MNDHFEGSLKGQLLVAMPGLDDPNFYHTVTCISEHTADGAVGIIINRVQDTIFSKEIFSELNIDYSPSAATIPLHIGGPVHLNEIFVIHGPPFEWEGCFQITSTLAMSNTIDILKALAVNKGPEAFLITLGCAGWGPGQLEEEIKQNAWLTSALVNEIVFDTPVELRWKEAMKAAGVDPALLSHTAGNA